MAHQKISVLLLCVLPLLSHAESFTTADVMSRSISKNCLDWSVIGVCFWLKCSPKCKIKTTPKIQHNLPDLTVVPHSHYSPWIEFRMLSKVEQTINILSDTSTAGGDIGRENQTSNMVRFKEVHVIGNPAAHFRNIFGVPFLCKSKAKPLHIYFNSANDENVLLWRGVDQDLSRLEIWTPGMREIGEWKSHTWGSVYPRIGFLVQAEDPKAGAVIAQRAIDIVTNDGQAFHYTPLGYQGYRWEVWGDQQATNKQDCDETGGLWSPPNPFQSGHEKGKCISRKSVQWLEGANEKTDKWQMISPITNNQCETFGTRGAWSDGKESEDGNYAFNYWRKYKCCIPRSGKYLGSIEF